MSAATNVEGSTPGRKSGITPDRVGTIIKTNIITIFVHKSMQNSSNFVSYDHQESQSSAAIEWGYFVNNIESVCS